MISVRAPAQHSNARNPSTLLSLFCFLSDKVSDTCCFFFEQKALRCKLSCPDSIRTFLLHAPPHPCQTGRTGYLPKIHPNFQSAVLLTQSNSRLHSAPPRTMTQTLTICQEDGHRAAELEAALSWLWACVVPVGSPFGLSVMFIFYTHIFHQNHKWFRTRQRKMGSGNYCGSRGGPHTFNMGLVPLIGRRWLVSIHVRTN